MHTKSASIAIAVTLTVLLAAGCAKQFRVVQDLERPVPRMSTCRIGTIVDELPVGTLDADRPTQLDILKFKDFLLDAMIDRDLMHMRSSADTSTQYVVRGAIIDFSRGSKAVNFIFGFGLGNAKLVVMLEFLDATTNEVLFSANLKSSVSSQAESLDVLYQRVSYNFTKALEERIKEQPEYW